VASALDIWRTRGYLDEGNKTILEQDTACQRASGGIQIALAPKQSDSRGISRIALPICESHVQRVIGKKHGRPLSPWAR
jgi:hypothetical protein